MSRIFSRKQSILSVGCATVVVRLELMPFQNGLTPGRIYTLVCAVAGQEITVREFRSAIKPLSPEFMQYLSTVLGLQATMLSQPTERLSVARAMCQAGALAKRSLC